MNATTRAVLLQGGRGVGEPVEAPVVVLPQTFTFFGGVDWRTGQLTLGDPELDTISIAGKILVFRSPAGGQGTAWKIGEMVANGSAPKALVVHRSNPVLVSGCVLARVPLLADLSEDPTTVLRTGDVVRIEPGAGRLTRVS